MSVRAVILALVCVAVMTTASTRRRQIQQRIADRVEAPDRYVDVGVTFCKIVQDPNGHEFIPGKPKVRVTERRHMGGIVDTGEMPSRIDPTVSEAWWSEDTEAPGDGKRVWYLSGDQWDAVFHDDDSILGQLVYGSMGAGKTRALAMWHYVRWIETLDERPVKRRRGGQTAPTEDRLEVVRAEMAEIYAPNWYRYRAAEATFVMCDGTRIELVSTYRQSQSQGSRLAGRNWSWCGRDEAQDQVAEHSEIEVRGRSARQDATGRILFKQFATATAKDASDWRELRDTLLASGEWIKRGLSVFRSPMYTPAFIAQKRSVLSDREFLRRYGDPKTGEPGDLPPELAVYYGWDRKRNLLPLPQIAKDVTAAVLTGYRSYLYPGEPFGLLCAHDPGVIFNTTEVLRLVMFGGVPTWAVVGELQTKQTTAREHGKKLADYLRENFYVRHRTIGGPNALVFVDPHGKGEGQTDYQSVYMALQKEGLDAFNPAPMSGKIGRKARIEMMNRLLGDNEAGIPRLVICKDQHGHVLAPKLVEAFESLKKRPGDDNPEGTQRKDEDDKTHAPAACAYGLWPFEQEAFTEATVKKALT